MRTTNVLKALAIFAVILIHSLSSYGRPFNLAFDATLRFCVPLFVALSGFGLAKKYQEQPFTLKDFFLRRLVKLLPWYIFWSAILYVLGNQGLPFWQMLIWGKADYHLYFVPMIFLLYLSFPVLFYLGKKYIHFLLPVALGFEIFWFLHTGSWSDQQQYISPATWIFYFVLGIALAQEKLFTWCKKYSKFLFFLTLVGLVLSAFDAYQIVNSGGNLLFATRFTKLPILLFAGGFISVSLTYDLKSEFLAHIGTISYVIYLSHTIVLRYIPHWPYPLYALAAIVFSLVLAEVVWQIESKFFNYLRTRSVRAG